MRRGLMAWDADEIPLEMLQARVHRLQDAMTAAGQDAMILYTNFVRSAAVSHLTAFSPYWADGILLVPQTGEPLFATTLSKRVGSWIQSVKPVGGLVTSPTPGAVLGKRLADGGGIRRLAILELDAFPSGLYDELAAALPGIAIVDGTETFAAARAHLDDVERRLLAHADTIASDALDNLRPDVATDLGGAVGTVEQAARSKGAEEVYIAIAPDLDADRRFLRLSGTRPLARRFAIRATVAYKGAWVRRTKTYAQDDKDRFAVARAESWFQNFAANIDAKRTLGGQIDASLAGVSGARLVGWMAEGVVGTRPLAAVASSESLSEAQARAPALVVTIALTIDGVPWCGAGLAGSAQGNSP
jgi:hypothetical protein